MRSKTRTISNLSPHIFLLAVLLIGLLTLSTNSVVGYASSTNLTVPTPTPTPTPIPGALVIQTNGDGPATPCSGTSCSTLRDALDTANNNPGPNTITFAAGVVGTISLTNGELASNDDVTIIGPGAATLTVSGNNASRVFNVAAGTTDISNLTLADGHASGSPASGAGLYVDFGATANLTDVVVQNNVAFDSGGGIYSSGSLTMSGGAVHDNTTAVGFSGPGAGLYFDSGSADLNNVQIYSNTADGSGGGIYLSYTASLTLNNSAVYSNTVTSGNGGGLYTTEYPFAVIAITNSAIYSNTVAGDGGGLYHSSVGEEGGNVATVANSTISGNSATGSGGGVYADNASLTLNNATIAKNTADSDNNASGDGGGIGGVDFGLATLDLGNTLIATNADLSGEAPDCSLGSLFVNINPYNLVGDDTGCGWTSGPGDIVNPVSTNLGPLQDNTGPTWTHALLTGSPAIDAGNNATCKATDQRGVARPQGAACDIGAFEAEFGGVPFPDIQPPTISLSAATVAAFQDAILSGDETLFSGSVTDNREAAGAEICTLASGESEPTCVVVPVSSSGQATADWEVDVTLPSSADGIIYTFTFYGIDATGNRTESPLIYFPISVDITGPQGMTVTASTAGGTITSVSAGDTIRDPSVTGLTIEWTGATDGSGVAEYLAGWTNNPTPELSALTSYSGAGTHTAFVSEATRWFGHAAAIDALGNITLQTIGPIFVDAPTTPDYINPDDGQGGVYRGWMESGGSLVGADYEAAHDGAYPVQKFYVSWDASYLRLAWVGADWNVDGDLSIYLDTASGGATQAYNPYGVGATIVIPEEGGNQMGADYLIHIEDNSNATLNSWDGSGWIEDQMLTSPEFIFDPSSAINTTDLYIPFAYLGSPTSLKLVAIASEEDALRVWAAMPDHNPLNSQRSVNPVAISTLDLPYALTQHYEWTNVGSAGVLPSNGQFEDADLHFELVAEPAGVSVGFLQHDLPGLTPPNTALDANLDGVPDMALPPALDVDPLPVGSGQVINYTLHYSNDGPADATSVMADVAAVGGLKDLSMTAISLGTISAGSSGSEVFTAVVNPTINGESAEIQVEVVDSTHSPFEWLWVQHDINSVPVANNDVYSTDEDTVLVEATVGPLGDGVLANDNDVDNDPLTGVLDTTTSHGVLVFNSDGSFTYSPTSNFCGADSFTYHANDGTVDSNIATVDIDVVCVNDSPVIGDGDLTVDSASINENNIVILSGVFTDPDVSDSHIATINWGDGSTNTEINLTVGERSFSTSHQYLDDNPSGTASDPYTVSLTLTDDDIGNAVDSTTVTVSNTNPVLTIDVATQTVQYGDRITNVIITGKDVATDPLQASISWNVNGGAFINGLPVGLSLTTNACVITGNSRTCTWTLGGVADVSAGTYLVRVTVEDDDLGQSNIEPVIEVMPEEVMVRFHGGNPRAVQVENDGNAISGPFDLRVDVKERFPDNGTSVLPGDIALADVAVALVPIGPGGTVTPTGCTTELHDVDYDARLTVTCTFDSVPINTYAVQVTVDGGYYGGFDEDVVVVYDPSQGFTTGGGTFTWPGSSDETTFGYTMENNKNGKNVKGKLMLVRRTPAGSHVVKSNAIDGLALGAENDFAWASFSGKTTYRSPEMEQPEGSHTFIAYVEDHGETNDRFWLQVRDKDGNVIVALSMDEPGATNATPIDTGGNIIVPR